jgi:peptide/nickel transport system ATP-binding protein
LDTVVAAAILELIADLRRELGVAVMFISHDLAMVRAICDEVSVLYAGRQVEHGPAGAFAGPPHHPYSDLLLASVPEMRRGWLEQARVREREAPAGAKADAGRCAFLARCPLSVPGLCDREPPPRLRLGRGSEALCHRSEADLLAVQAAAPLAVSPG